VSRTGAARSGIFFYVAETLFQRVGHGGASALARPNTLASFDTALALGVDMIEFDVRSWRGQLVLAHSSLDARRGSVALADALEHLASERFRSIELNVDVKHLGCERELLAALRELGLLGRTLVSSQIAAVVDRVRALEPRARTGISVGGRLARLSRCWGDWRRQVLSGLQVGRWDALMAQHKLIDAQLLEQVRSRGGRLYAWTVNERGRIESLRALGVHGITTADPRLFAPVAAGR
jgi:glycerophosphoryl diester phosphodiesterase